MSNDDSPTEESKPKAVYEQTEDEDILVVFAPGQMGVIPEIVVPMTSRAKSLFERWGMAIGATGIEAPQSALDLINSMPLDWVVSTKHMKADGEHLISKITLPQPRIVLH